MSRRDNDSSVLLRDIEDSLRRVLSQAQIKAAPLTDEELADHFKKVDEHVATQPRVAERWVCHLTPQGVRELSLKLAIETAVNGRDYNGEFTADDILETARKYETFINGAVAPTGGDE